MLLKYLQAMETQAAWANHFRYYAGEFAEKMLSTAKSEESASSSFATVETVLSCGTPSYMHEEFCDLVDGQCEGFPDDVGFDPTWLPSDCGFLWLEKPLGIPASIADFPNPTIPAIGWCDFDDHTQFISFLRLPNGGFAPLGMSVILHGATLAASADNHSIAWQGDESDFITKQMWWEIRWEFTAFFLMSQKITAVAEEKASSLVRDMAKRKGRPIQPSIKIVSFRKREYSHHLTGESNREYHCQWIVDWHIRKQPYKGGVVKPILIDSYVKGPADKPLKPVTKKLFVARY